MRFHPRRRLLWVFLLLTASLTLVCSWTSTQWVNTTFPGFFVMDNRVVASISLPHWSIASHPRLYQQEIVAINGRPVETTASLYAEVRTLPAGASATYTLQQHGQRTEVSLPTARFTGKDWSLLFGVYIVNGITFALIGMLAWYWNPASATCHALLSLGLTVALFIVTAADLYAPHWFFRLHILGEVFFPAAIIHLALVFPRERLGRLRALWLALPYGVSGVLGLSYELVLYQPAAYSLLHNLCTFYAGLAGCLFISKIAWDYVGAPLGEIQQKIRVVVLGSLCGYGFPTVLLLLAGVKGGQVAINYAAFSLFIFPLSVGYVLVTQDLMRVEMLLRRSVSVLTGFAFVALCLGGSGEDARAALTQGLHGGHGTDRNALYQRHDKQILPLVNAHSHTAATRGKRTSVMRTPSDDLRRLTSSHPLFQFSRGDPDLTIRVRLTTVSGFP